MSHGPHDGRVEVISGVRFSGKSEELLRRIRRELLARQRVQLFKARVAHGWPGPSRVGPNDGSDGDALPVASSREIRDRVNPETDVVGIDDVHLLDDGVVRLVQWLADRRVRVIVAGTDMDFRGEPLGSMGDLMATAEVVDKLHAVCVRCGDPATRTQRLIDGRPAPPEAPLVHVDGVETHEARCRRCHELPEPGRHQTELDIEGAAEAWAERTRYW